MYFQQSDSDIFPANSNERILHVRKLTWPCTIEIAWVDLGRPYPGSYRQEILANRGQKVRSRSTGVIQSCTANWELLLLFFRDLKLVSGAVGVTSGFTDFAWILACNLHFL